VRALWKPNGKILLSWRTLPGYVKDRAWKQFRTLELVSSRVHHVPAPTMSNGLRQQKTYSLAASIFLVQSGHKP